MLALIIIAGLLIAGGLFFLVVSTVGLLRFPDFYTRAHAMGKSDTLGMVLILSGLAIYNGLELSTFKLLLIVFFIMIANPTATHALARAALRSGLPLWTQNKPADTDEEDDQG